ncbi:kinase-like domain-containing protein [Mycena alexandri]|uniref:Kinase-like domain-containing protein n=1 Tax=Mycena alexandri TaxID=1745969 RepID=A0AAD6WTB2_9AGAR|nr:kinase-like domain-containing protein [Mycena alexandri]
MWQTMLLSIALGGLTVFLLWYLLPRSSSFNLPDLLDTPEDPRRLWLSADGFFRRHKLVPFGSPAYQSAVDPPRVPPHRSFLPRETEDFVHRLWRFGTSAKLTSWSGPNSRHWLALDRFGRNVYIKLCPLDSNEWKILEYLSDTTPDRHPWNRTIPIIEFIRTPLSMVILQACWGSSAFSPPWDSLRTRLYLARQLLQGLTYMHMKGVAHGDVHPENISLFDFQLAFIDFENSIRVPAGSLQALAPVGDIRPPEPFGAPELVSTSHVDFFAADVFSVGQVLLSELQSAGTSQQTSIPRYLGLLTKMTVPSPTQRPSAAEALRGLEEIIGDCL